MKNIFLSLLFLLPQLAFAQWATLPIQTTASLTAVNFKNDTEGFTCGGNQIFQTIDGGATWTLRFQGEDLWVIEDIRVVDNTTVIAVGEDFNTGTSLVLRSANNGATWTHIVTGSTAFLKAVFFVDDLTGYAAGSGGAILVSQDAGLNWVPQTTGTTSTLQSVFFQDNLHGFAAGGAPGSSKLLQTADGGDHWTAINLNTTSNLQSVFFTNSQTGYVVGWEGGIFKTTDAGTTWNVQNSVNMSGNLDVFFTSDQTGYIVGGASGMASIQQTTDGGASWQEVAPSVPHGLIGVFFPSDEIGYVVGATGTILKTTTGGTTASQEVPPASRIHCFPNPVSQRLTIRIPDFSLVDLKIYNNSGVLLQTINGTSANLEVDFSAWPAGNYYVAFEGDNQHLVEKISKL